MDGASEAGHNSQPMSHLQQLYDLFAPWLPALTLGGLIMAVASMIAIPWLVVRMPPDYFTSASKPENQRSPLGWLLWLARNLCALLLLVAGILMLVLPGQGILTILIAIGVSTFPGKYHLERAIVRQARVFRALNWIRQRYNRPPLDHPDQEAPWEH